MGHLAIYLPEGTFELSEGDWKEDPVPGVLGGGGCGEVRLLVRQEDGAHRTAAQQTQEHLVGRIAVGQTHLNTVLGKVRVRYQEISRWIRVRCLHSSLLHSTLRPGLFPRI